MIIAELFSRLGLKVDEGSWNQGDKRIDIMKRGLEALAVAFSIHAIKDMIEDVEHLATNAARTGKMFGITAESVQELGFAAKMSGVDGEELNKSLGHLARGMQELSKGEGPASDAFHKLGISAKDFKGETLDQNLELLATKFAKMPDGALKASLAMDIFGKSGRDLIPFLDKGQKGIVALRNEAHELGVIVSDEDVTGFKELHHNQKLLSATWQGLKTQVVTALLPALNDLATGAVGWVKANRELIKSALTKVIQGLAIAARVLGTAISWVVDIIGFFTENSTGAAVALGVLGGIMTAFALKAAAAWVLALGPLDLLFIAIAAVTAGIVYVIKHWDKFGPAVQKVRDKIASFGEWVLDVPHKIAKAFEDAWTAIKEGAEAAFDYIEGLPVIKQLIQIGHIIANPRGAAQGVVDGVKGLITGSVAPPHPGEASKKSDEFNPDVPHPSQIGRLDEFNPDVHLSPQPTPNVFVAPTAPSIVTTLPPNVASAGNAPTSFSATFGDTHVDVTAPAGTDAAALGRMIGDHVAEKQQAMLDQAFATLRGGVR